MRKQIIILSGLLIISQSYSETELQQAKRVAMHYYQEYVSACVSDEQNRMDFRLSPTDNIQNAKLGEPMKLMEINPDKILSVNNYTDIKNFLVPLDSYIFPIRFNGELKLLFTITKFNGKDHFEVNEIGNAPIAQELNVVAKRWPSAKGYRPVLCVNFQTMTYAFSFPSISKNNLTLIIPADSEIRNGYTALSSLEQTIPYLRNKLKKFY